MSSAASGVLRLPDQGICPCTPKGGQRTDSQIGSRSRAHQNSSPKLIVESKNP